MKDATKQTFVETKKTTKPLTKRGRRRAIYPVAPKENKRTNSCPSPSTTYETNEHEQHAPEPLTTTQMPETAIPTDSQPSAMYIPWYLYITSIELP